MKLKMYLKSLFFVPEEFDHEHKRHFKFIWWHKWKQIFALKLSAILVFVLLFLFVAVAYAQAPLQEIISKFSRPKPLTQSTEVLPKEIQRAIEDLAEGKIKEEQANATLPLNNPEEILSGGLLQPVVESIEGLVTRNPADRARLRIKKNNRLAAKLQRVLTQDKSSRAVKQAVSIIQGIGAETDRIVADPKVQTDREILTLQIKQYNRLQLIIQQLEDSLSFNNYLTIEDARQKYLVSTAARAINTAPSLETIHNIGVPVAASFVGDDFAELKAIEVISDFESGVKPEAKEKLLGLEKELAVAFEKKMLKLPRDVRNRKLQDYIQYSFGDPILQIRSIERMKDQMNDRGVILGLNSLKELAMKRLINRIFELDNQEAINQYTDRILQNPEDLKILGEMELAVNSGRDEVRKQKLLQMRTSVEGRVARFFASGDLEAYFKQQESKSIDILDVLLASNLNTIISSRSEAPNELKQKFADVKNKTHKAFIDKVSSKDFVTKSSLAYNPVSSKADVRTLLASPQGIQILQIIRNESNASDKSKLDIAIRSQSTILQEHILAQVNDPETFEDYAAFIENNISVKQTLQTNLGRNFLTNLSKKTAVIQKMDLEDEQKQYETMQQIVQTIFLSKSQTDFERQLPTQIQQQISQVKKTLANRNVPRMTVPDGINLPKTAKLSDSIEQAIIQAAKQRIKNNQQSKEVKLDLTVSAKDLGIAEPLILPDSLFYPLKKLVRTIELALTFGPLQRAQVLIRQDNDKTLEAAKLLEKSSSRETINLALATLAEVEKDFGKLKENSAKLDKLRQEQPKKVELLVDQIIKNGLARQTVFASIEDKVYGADYVRVEKIRQSVLKDGVESLLQLTGGDAQILVQKLELAAYAQSGSKFKELKAIELLTEIKRFQPKKIDQILEASKNRLVKQFETHLLTIEKKEQERELLAYAEGLPGNAIRQFEAYEQLKDGFTNRETLLLAERLKDKAVENLRDQIGEITDSETLQEYANEVIGNKPEDLKIVTEIELRVETPAIGGILTPIEEKIEDIKAEVEQNIVQAVISDPTTLIESDLFSDSSNTVSVVDVIVAKELETLVESAPEAPETLVETVQQLAEETTSQFIASVSNTTINTTESLQTLEPEPQIIAELIALKEETSPSVDAQIDVAIVTQVNLIKEYLTTEVNDPATFETYLAQIQEDPVVAQIVAQVGGAQFTQTLEQTAQEVNVTAQSEQTVLETTVAEVTREVFSNTSSGQTLIETLPVTVQEEIQQVKEEMPVEQITPVEVVPTITVSVEQPPVTSEPAPVQTETTPPAATEVTPPAETQSAPALEAPTVPAL